MLQWYVLLGTLGVHSIEDIRQRKINVLLTLFSGIVGILLHLIFQNQSIFQMLLGVLPGLAITGLSYLTKGKIGLGDGVVCMLTGLYLGFLKNLLLVYSSFLLATVWGIVLICVKRNGKTEKLPFIPFLFLAYIFLLLGEVGT